MKHYIYILKSKQDDKHYIGYTSNIERRIREHKNGQVKSTKHRRPLTLQYTEEFKTKNEAQKREKFFKTGKGREELKKILMKN